MSLFKKFGVSLIIISTISTVFSQTVFAEYVTDFRVRTEADKESYDINDTVVITMHAENYTNRDITLNFSTGCQMGVEVFLNDELKFSEDMYPRNCSDSSVSVLIPDQKKAVWTRTFQSTDEGYPFYENGRYKVHAFIKDHEDEDWYTQATSFVTVVFGIESLYPFNDIYDHWGLVYILKLFDLRVTKGYEDGGYHPNANINRAEIVKLALAGAEIAVPDTAEVPEDFKFNDLDEWQIPWIYEAWNRGVVQGYDEFTFAPGQNVTRAEALKIALLAFDTDIPDTSDEWSFDDAKDHWASSYINFAFLNYIVAGRADGEFYPNDPITRAEAAKIVSKLIEL